MQETWLQSLGWEDPLEKEMTIHSSALAWEILWTEEPGVLLSMGFSRQEYWSGVSILLQVIFLTALQVDSLPLSHQGSPHYLAPSRHLFICIVVCNVTFLEFL